MSGRVLAVVGPSGAGKDTLLAGICGPGGPHWVRRVITRPATPGGEPFEGVDEETFQRRQAAGEFVLHWRAHGLAYGLPHAEFTPLTEGRDVIFNGSRAILVQAARQFPGLCVILVTAPPAVLATRLAARGRETAPEIADRLAREAPLPDGLPVITIVNDATPEAGIARLRAALQATETR